MVKIKYNHSRYRGEKVQTRITLDEKEVLDAFASCNGITTSETIRWAIQNIVRNEGLDPRESKILDAKNLLWNTAKKILEDTDN